MVALLLFLIGLAWWGSAYLFPRLESLLSAVIAGRVTDLVNVERAKLDLPPLEPDPLLTAAAERKAADMAVRGYFSHQTPEGATPWVWLEQSGYRYLSAGENLALNFDQSGAVTRAWMDSPAHRANILRPEFADIGIGVAKGEFEGGEAVFVVQFFGTPAPVVLK